MNITKRLSQGLLALMFFASLPAAADSFEAYMRENAKDPVLKSKVKHQDAFGPAGSYNTDDLENAKTGSKNKKIQITGQKFSMPKTDFVENKIGGGGGGSGSFGAGSSSSSFSSTSSSSSSSSGSSSGASLASGGGKASGAKANANSAGSLIDSDSSDVGASEAASNYTTSSAGGGDSAGFVAQPKTPRATGTNLPYSNYSSSGVYNVGDHSVNQNLDAKQVTGQLLGQYYEERARQRRLAAEARERQLAEQRARIAAQEEAQRQAYLNNRSRFGSND